MIPEPSQLQALIVPFLFKIAGAFLQGLRPFQVGDDVLAAGVEGTVEELGMLVTTILTPDSVRTMVPNGKLFGDTLKNYSSHPFRRVELVAQLDNSADVLSANGFPVPRIPVQMASAN
jgi:small conductance mechanosensitive channel